MSKLKESTMAMKKALNEKDDEINDLTRLVNISKDSLTEVYALRKAQAESDKEIAMMRS